MNKWVWITSIALLASSQCAARTSYEEKQELARIKHIQLRKQKEQEYAKRIVRNTQLQTTRKKQRRAQDAQAEVERQQYATQQEEYRDEVHHFTQLTQELALPVYSERPLTDIMQEAQISLQKITAYNPKTTNIFQAQLERALRNGKHPMSPDGKRVYPNTQLIAQQSVQSLIDYTQHAHEMVQETAHEAQETASNMQQMLADHRAQMTELITQLNEAERRLKQVDVQLTKLNTTIKKGELEVTQKQAEAVNLAQCIDTFTTASSKLSQDRINHAENLVSSLEQQTALLMQRMQKIDDVLRSAEGLQNTKN
jgi:hypothetical protein